MKINQFGVVGIIGVVVSMTAACGGNPVKPGALNPGVGNGGSGSNSFILSDPKLAAPALEPCANQPIPEPGQNESDIFVAMCDVVIADEPPAAEEAPATEQVPATDEAQADAVAPDAVIGEATTGDFPAIRSLHR